MRCLYLKGVWCGCGVGGHDKVRKAWLDEAWKAWRLSQVLQSWTANELPLTWSELSIDASIGAIDIDEDVS